MITTITRSMLTARRPITQEIVAAKVSSPVKGISSVGVVAWWSTLQRRAAVPFNLDPYSYKCVCPMTLYDTVYVRSKPVLYKCQQKSVSFIRYYNSLYYIVYAAVV